MSGQTIADRRLHPLSIGLRYLKNLPSTLLGLPALVTFLSDKGIGYFVPIAVAVGLGALLVNWIVWRRFSYGLGAREIVIESGVLSRNRRSIPFARIQDVDIERGPLERLLGLAKVRIETGGAGSDEGVLDSLSVREADRLRAALRAGKAGELGDAAPAPAGRVIFAMGVPRVILSGVFNFSLLYLAGLFALLQAFEDYLPWDRLLGLAEDGFADRFAPGTIAAVLLLAIVLGIATGIVRTLARDYGFRLVEEPQGFRRERGLLTRSEVAIPRRRVQLALVRAHLMRRIAGWYELSVQTLSAERDGIGGKQSLAPLAHEAEVEAVLAEVKRMALPDPASLVQVSRGHVLRGILSHTLGPLAAIAAVALFASAALLAIALVPLLILGAIVERRAHRYALVGDTLYVRRGFWQTKLWIVPLASAQAIRITRSPIQRLLGVATVLVDTAGASALSDPRIVDLADAKAVALADAVAGHLRRKPGPEQKSANSTFDSAPGAS